MDADFPILAAAPGTDTRAHDEEFDRNVSCSGGWNYIEVTPLNDVWALNDVRAIYGHLRNGSAL